MNGADALFEAIANRLEIYDNPLIEMLRRNNIPCDNPLKIGDFILEHDMDLVRLEFQSCAKYTLFDAYGTVIEEIEIQKWRG